MKRRDWFIQAYNCHAACTEDQIIISADVLQKENDFYYIEQMLEHTTTNLRKSGIKKNVETLFVDAGYFRENLDIKHIEKKVQSCCCAQKTLISLKKKLKKEYIYNIKFLKKIKQKPYGFAIVDLLLAQYL